MSNLDLRSATPFPDGRPEPDSGTPLEHGTFPEALRSAEVAPDGQDAMWALLDEWKPGEPSAGFAEAVVARIRDEEEAAGSLAEGQRLASGPAGWMHGLRMWLAGLGAVRGFGLAGAVATVIFAALLLRSPVDPVEQPEAESGTMEFTAQQAETALEDLTMLDELYNAPVPEEIQNKRI